ncbi:MFS transporter [Actinomadura sp. NEAU-AAG7]|nr:MFS transporter [Actinomadura sp. NEAU-AAG7]
MVQGARRRPRGPVRLARRFAALPRSRLHRPPRPGAVLASVRYRWVVLGIATFAQAASSFFVQGIGAMGITLQRDLDLSTAQLGLLLSAAQFAPLIGLVVAGELLDRYNERWVVGAGACVVAAGLGAGSLAPGYAALLGVLLVVGAGYSTAQPGGSKAVASWFDASQRGLAMGLRQAGLPLGGALAAAVLPLVADVQGWRTALVVGGCVALAGAAVFMGFYRAPPLPEAPRGEKVTLATRVRMLREPSMVKIMLSGTSLISVQSGILVLTVLYLHDVTELGAGAAALVLVVAQGAGVAGRICMAAWSDRVGSGRYASVMICMVAVVAGMAALATPLGRAAPTACLLFVWLGFFGYGWYGPWVAYVAESAPPGKTGFALGLAMSVNQIAIILAPPLLGLLRDATGGFTPVWGVLAAMTGVALAVTARAQRRPCAV